MQVLLVTIVVATIATAILRIAISRTTTAANTVRTISAKNLLEGCNAQVQSAMTRATIAGTDPLAAIAAVTPCKIKAGPNPTDIITVNVDVKTVTDLNTNVQFQKLTFRVDGNDLNKL